MLVNLWVKGGGGSYSVFKCENCTYLQLLQLETLMEKDAQVGKQMNYVNGEIDKMKDCLTNSRLQTL